MRRKQLCAVPLCLILSLCACSQGGTVADLKNSAENIIQYKETYSLPTPAYSSSLTPSPAAIAADLSSEGEAASLPAQAAAASQPPAPTYMPADIPAVSPVPSATPAASPSPAPTDEPEPSPTSASTATYPPAPANSAAAAPTPVPAFTPYPESMMAPKPQSIPYSTPKPTPEPTPVPVYEPNPQGVTGEDIVNLAMQYVGYKYLYGGKSPETGFDCSGLVYYCYGYYGIVLNRTADAQAKNGAHVELDDLEPGDILCFYSGSWIGHVGIYIGGGSYIHAEGSAVGVVLADVNTRNCKIEARRIIEK